MQWLSRLFSGITHHLAIWRMAWKHENTNRSKRNLNSHELEFLPAVLEIQETPASPIGRTIGFLVIALFTLALIWAYFGEIDIVAVAQGKIVPSDHTKVIQPLEAGVITRIHVRDGQIIKQGDKLVELDATQSGADQERLHNEWIQTQLEAARTRALLEGKPMFESPPNADQAAIALQRQLLHDQRTEQKARVDGIKSKIEQHKASIQQAEINMSRLEQTIPLTEQRLQAVKDMLDQNYASRVQYLELQETYIDKVESLGALEQERQKELAALKVAKNELEQVDSQFKTTLLTELAMLETKAKSYSQELRKATSRAGQQTLTAPIDGVVQQLAVHTIGGVVTPAQQLMVIVPKEDQLEIEAWVQNKDIGFVNENDTAEIKVEAFQFTKYGTIDGTIQTLSRAAVPLENVGLVYAAKLNMARSVMQVGDKEVQLSPGMNVSVEIKTGTRRLIEYFLTPLLRGFNESVRER